MNETAHIGGNSYELAREMRKRMPCPIHNNLQTRIANTSFVEMCLRHQQQSKVPAAVKFSPGRSHCVGCATGKLIEDGKKFNKPDSVVWLG